MYNPLSGIGRDPRKNSRGPGLTPEKLKYLAARKAALAAVRELHRLTNPTTSHDHAAILAAEQKRERRRVRNVGIAFRLTIRGLST